MPVFLCPSFQKSPSSNVRVLPICTKDDVPDDCKAIPDIEVKLEDAFNYVHSDWRDVALLLQSQPTAELAHMPTMSTYASDFGVMLAWVRVAEALQQEAEDTLVICPDPWLYRALAMIPGVQSKRPPGILIPQLKALLRGYLSRTRVAARSAWSKWKMRSHRRRAKSDQSYLLVYGHPESNADGHDAYFSDLMKQLPAIARIMHTDCGAEFAAKLGKDNRTLSLHAWGRYRRCFALPFLKWTPNTQKLSPQIAWLIKRAAILEAHGGSAAMNKWQIDCQSGWLKDTSPHAIAWPWENHPWERDLVRKARSLGIKTYGYQHTVVGPHMFNQGADANADGLASIPDIILLNGHAYVDDLIRCGIPKTRMICIGSHRVGGATLPAYSTKGPIFLALSNNPAFAAQMIAAARPLASAETPFVVKAHPLCPFEFNPSDHFESTSVPLSELPPLRALIYCTGTSGLEGLLAGIPTYRFLPKNGIALDILPQGMHIKPITALNMKDALEETESPAKIDTNTLFPPPDIAYWKRLMDVDQTE